MVVAGSVRTVSCLLDFLQMSTPQADPLLDKLVSDFGGNYVFALDLLEQYRQDRKAVEPSWRAYFDEALGVRPEPEAPPVTVIVNEAPPEPRRAS